MQSHKRFDVERERRRGKETKDKGRLKAKQSRQRQETGSRCNRVEETQGRAGCVENSVKWSLIKVANRFVSSLLIRPDSWRKGGKKRVTRD